MNHQRARYIEVLKQWVNFLMTWQLGYNYTRQHVHVESVCMSALGT
jgi:hypothetical protein